MDKETLGVRALTSSCSRRWGRPRPSPGRSGRRSTPTARPTAARFEMNH